MARRSLGRDGWGTTKLTRKGHVAVTNGDIRDKMGLSTIESLLRYRRLRWWQSMLKDPGRHNLYLASVFGRFDWETTDDFN